MSQIGACGKGNGACPAFVDDLMLCCCRRRLVILRRLRSSTAGMSVRFFAAAFESAARYRSDLGEASAWLFGIARNVLLRSVRRGRVQDETRRRLGMRVLVLDDDALERVEELASREQRAVSALDGLSGVLREAVAGRVIDEREYRELAEALCCSESVVRQRVRRGLAQIRDHLEAER
jgi:RNA polymerase sigma factor (sigma-70 family)